MTSVTISHKAQACDCGRPAGGSRVCAECRWLDGSRPAEKRVIAAMRELGAATVAEIEAEAYGDQNARTRTLETLAYLVERGRVAMTRDEDGRAVYRLRGAR